MKISFIIVNYQSREYLKKCLLSLKERVAGLEYEVIVVNYDEDFLSQEAGKGIFRFSVIEIGKNLGFGAGCNRGARQAKGEILCFLNPDTEIISNNVDKLIEEFDKNKKLGIVGPSLIDENGKIQSWIAGRQVTLWSVILNNLGYKRDKKIWESPVPIECDWVSGAALFTKREIFQEIGGFDERFFMYFEDIDFCWRVRQANYTILYYPLVKIKHLGGRSFSSKKRQKRLYYVSQFRYFSKKYARVLDRKGGLSQRY